MYVLGTAGHIDHGKSVLVRALTGIDPDRLREEQERGMTIDLGFAWMKLPGGEEVGIVDVPGHERFIKNMLAGVGGIDLALLVIAASEGVMPQTREHLAILDLLGIKKGIVVLTKKDLVDEDMLTLVRMDVEELVSTTVFAGAPIMDVSAVTGEGLEELVLEIDAMLGGTEPKKDTGKPRLPVDRVFTIAGSGTVVTGTLIDSSLFTGTEIEIVPGLLKSRIRGLQTHKQRVDTASPGNRVAVNLVGIPVADIKRGDVLTTPGWLRQTTMVSARLRLLPHLSRPFAHNTTVSFHTGAAETLAKVRLLDAEKLPAGETGLVQLLLDRPVAVVKGDRFIIRSSVDTLGGGEIIDAHTKRLRRFKEQIIESLEVKEGGTLDDVIIARIETAQPVELAAFIRESNLSGEETISVIESLLEDGRIVAAGKENQRLLYTAGGWNRLVTQLRKVLEEYHRKNPVKPGMAKAELGSRLKLGKQAPDIWQKLASEGIISEEGSAIRLDSFRMTLSSSQQQIIDNYLRAIGENPYSPPGDIVPEPDLLNMLISENKVVKISGNIVFSRAAYDDIVDKIVAHIRDNGTITLPGVRDLFGTSRKYAQAIVEHLDEKKITRRVGDDRVLYSGKPEV